jgi:hypothetical protein
MKKIFTIFDYAYNPPEPLYTSIYDTNTKNVEYLPMYIKQSNLTIKQIKTNIQKLRYIIENNDVMLNDAISHYLAIDINSNHYLYETRQEQKIPNDMSLKKYSTLMLTKMPKEPEPWMDIKGKSARVYSHLTKKGVHYGPHLVYPIYDNKTATGRSRTKGFNIQGMTSKDPIKSVDEDYYFVCFDWVSADMRVAGYLSGDKFINDSFLISDPYTEIANLLGNDINRDECKIEMLKSIYSLNDSPLFDLMPTMRNWIKLKKSEFQENKKLRTIMGMIIDSENIKTAFNGIIQGSVAEAIQSSITKIGKTNLDCILAEIHDSLVVTVESQNNIQDIINFIVPILSKPFDNIDLTFSVKVSIGTKWKQWKPYKVYR